MSREDTIQLVRRDRKEAAAGAAPYLYPVCGRRLLVHLRQPARGRG